MSSKDEARRIAANIAKLGFPTSKEQIAGRKAFALDVTETDAGVDFKPVLMRRANWRHILPKILVATTDAAV